MPIKTTQSSRAPVGPFRRFAYCFLLVLLSTAATIGCERPVEPGPASKGLGEPDPASTGPGAPDPAISLAITPTGATFAYRSPTPPPGDTGHTPPSDSQRVTATATRLGGFSGSVGLTVSGAPSGVTAAVSNVQTTGAVTTATITIVVGAGVATGVYPLVVHGTGSGVSEVTRVFTLTVTPPPGPGSYTISVTPSTVVLAQGQPWWAPTRATVYLVRTNFPGWVNVRVENLPTGVHLYVPDNGALGSSAVLFLSVDPDAPIGTFANVLVRAASAGVPDQTAPLTLTITEAPFTLAGSPSALTLVQGGAPQTTTVSIVRNNFTDPVTLEAAWWEGGTDGLPPGITGAFTPSLTGGNTSVLSLSAAPSTPPGVYDISVSGTSGTAAYCCVPLRVTVVSP